MKPFARFYIKVLEIISILIMISSCIRLSQVYDLNPYSPNRNDNISLVGCYWNDCGFYQYNGRYISMVISELIWNIVSIDGKEYIIANVPMKSIGEHQDYSIVALYLLIPFYGIELGDDYCDVDMASMVTLCSFKKKYFTIEEQSVKSINAYLKITVNYQNIGDLIQGSFIGEGGAIEIGNDGLQNIVIEKGIFSFNRKDRFIKEYSYENWLEDIEISNTTHLYIN